MLIDCRECGSRVSDEAQQCPHCGCRGPSGRYTYVQDGIEFTVNENALEECAKCGQKTKHRVIDSYWEIPGRGHVIAKNKIAGSAGTLTYGGAIGKNSVERNKGRKRSSSRQSGLGPRAICRLRFHFGLQALFYR